MLYGTGFALAFGWGKAETITMSTEAPIGKDPEHTDSHRQR
jgi:hypothetical protein